ncbi:MAG: hypothetical protein NXI24_17000 [bacterium]|nr:hypothetical protein [bacterium]
MSRLAYRSVARLACFRPVVMWAAFSLAACSYGHPIVGIFPEDPQDDGLNLSLLLAGLAIASNLGPASTGCAPNGQIMIAANNATNGRLALFRCNRDGSGCVHIDASAAAGQGNDSGFEPNMVFDPVNNRLLVAVADGSVGPRLGLYRCNADGTGCVFLVLSGGADSGHTPSAGVDLVNNRLAVASRDSTGGALRLGMHLCNLDGTGCASTDVSAATGQGNFTGFNPSLVVDNIDQQLYTATFNNGASNTVGFFRCNLNAGACTFTNASTAAGLGANTGVAPSLIHDQAGGRNLFVSRNSTLGALNGIRCQEDGSACVAVDVTAGFSAGNSRSFLGPDNRVYTSARNPDTGNRASLWRCEIDGTNCLHANLGAALADDTGHEPDVVADDSCAYVASRNDASASSVLYYICERDGSACQFVDVTAATGTAFGVTDINLLLL